ncbi:MAG: hypothetical protein N3A66_09605, partial [Planctomycetota bacterium]|nr:hypothetical protein [Planctomycetota bacterium]
MPIWLNSRKISAFPFRWRGRRGMSAALMDPYGNGYWVPDAGQLRVARRRQQSRDAWNQGRTVGDFSVAWFDHGRAPQDDGYGSQRYHYALLVQTSPMALAAYS